MGGVRSASGKKSGERREALLRRQRKKSGVERGDVKVISGEAPEEQKGRRHEGHHGRRQGRKRRRQRVRPPLRIKFENEYAIQTRWKDVLSLSLYKLVGTPILASN